MIMKYARFLTLALGSTLLINTVFPQEVSPEVTFEKQPLLILPCQRR